VDEVVDRGLLGMEGSMDEIRARCRVERGDPLLTSAVRGPDSNGGAR
jgi:hypothetical protein